MRRTAEVLLTMVGALALLWFFLPNLTLPVVALPLTHRRLVTTTGGWRSQFLSARRQNTTGLPSGIYRQVFEGGMRDSD